MGKTDPYIKISKVYRQTLTKKMLLVPGIVRALRKNFVKGERLLDVGSGIGDFYEIATKMGYKYSGLDRSESMISRAKASHPLGKFDLLPATNFTDKYKTKFSVILLNLILQDNPLKDEKKIISEVSKCLGRSGVAIVGIHHPHLDHYMRFGLLNNSNIKTNFKDYFMSDGKYFLKYFYEEGSADFTDYHITLQDYSEMFTNSGFEIIAIDECPPDKKLEKLSKKKFEEKKLYPTYMVFTLRKK